MAHRIQRRNILKRTMRNVVNGEVGFDTDRYLHFQARALRAFMHRSRDILYIEFGGKIIHDKHSSRVLPGYREDAKFELIKLLCRDGEPIFVVSARDILRGRIRGDFNLTYDDETIRKLNALKRRGLPVRHVILTMVPAEHVEAPVLRDFIMRLKRKGIATYLMPVIKDYSKNKEYLHYLASTPYVPIRKKLIIILSPGGGSGKFGVCLSQLYHQMARGVAPRYLKFETFPVHDLPVKHPLNLAYMAASADFYDVVTKDHRHGTATSYQRDLDNYEKLHILARHFGTYGKHLKKITSATHMGINMLSRGIIDDEVVQKEAAAEIARRLIRYRYEVARGTEKPETLARVRELIKTL